MCFQLTPTFITLDDFDYKYDSLQISQIWEPTTAKQMTIDRLTD